MTDRKRIAIVTGGNRGIGRSAVLSLAQRGVDVIFTYNVNADRAQQVVSEASGALRKAATPKVDARRTGHLR